MAMRGCSDDIGKPSARGRSDQALLGFPLVSGFKLGQELDLAAGQRSDWQTVAVNDPIGGERGKPLSRRQDADQIERIGARQRHPLIRRWPPAHLSQEADRIRKRELFARETGYESAAAYLPPRLEPAVHAQEIPPRWKPTGLLRQKAPEDDAITGEQRARRIFDRRFARRVAVVLQRHTIDQGPAAAALDVEAKHAPAPLHAWGRLALPRGHEQSAQAAETVGSREPERCEFAERFLKVRAQEARGFRQFVKEQSAARAQGIEHGLSASAHGSGAAQRRERHP